MLSFTGSLTLDDQIALNRCATKLSRTAVSGRVAIIGTLFFGLATVLIIARGYPSTLWGPAIGLFFVTSMYLPFVQGLLVKEQFKKHPPVEHTIELSEDKIAVRNANQQVNSTWSEVKEVWKTKYGYVFLSRYDTAWFFLPERLFSDTETKTKILTLLAASRTTVKDVVIN